MKEQQRGIEFGVDYYPEQWDRSLWASDAQRMKEMGLSTVRLMEFAWPILEPKEGVYDFTLFDEVIDILSQEGLSVILGTPTATTPVWLWQKDPSLLQEHPSGHRHDWGARREACFNSPIYREATKNIVEKIASHWGRDDRVIGWQVDNEIGHEGSDVCICGHCRKVWSQWLQDRYKDIDSLNKTWGTVFWGRTFTDFKQIPVPAKQLSVDHNPSLLLDYDRFCSDTIIGFCDMQVAILRDRTNGQWVSTNLYMPPLGTPIDMERLVLNMDFAGYDNYPVWGDMTEPLPYFYIAMIFSYIRGLKGRKPFTIFEQMSGFQGHTCLGYRPPDEQVALWTNQAAVHGAERIIYFRWRTAPFAQEQLCHGILEPDNMESPLYRILKKNITDNNRLFKKISGTSVKSEACVVYDMDNRRLLQHQFMTKGLYYNPAPYLQLGYAVELAKSYAPFAIFNINTDVRTPANIDLSDYKIISLPMYVMTDGEFVARLEHWVKKGGTLVLGWRAGIKDRNNNSTRSSLPGLFSSMAGIKINTFESLNETKIPIRIGIIPAKGESWADILEPTTAKPIARYTDKKKWYRGNPCVTVNNYGEGMVYYLGTTPNEIGLFFLYRKIIKSAGIRPRFYGKGIEVIRRQDHNNNDIDIILNHTPNKKMVQWHWIPPFGVRFKQL